MINISIVTAALRLAEKHNNVYLAAAGLYRMKKSVNKGDQSRHDALGQIITESLWVNVALYH